MLISAQISLYPLRQTDLSSSIENVLGILKQYELNVTPGTMSTVASGEDEKIFNAIREAFVSSSKKGDIVMVVTYSNTCPV